MTWTSFWPRLWTVLPETLRTDLTTAQDAYTASARLTAWGLLYTLLGIAWWPAIVLGATVVAAGWRQARTAAPVLADLIETAADLYTSDLAAKLGIPATTPLTPNTGQAITGVLSKTSSCTPGQTPADDPMALPTPSLGVPPTPSTPGQGQGLNTSDARHQSPSSPRTPRFSGPQHSSLQGSPDSTESPSK